MRRIRYGMAALALLGACTPVYGPTQEGRLCRSLPFENERDQCFGRLEVQGYTQLRDQLGGRASEDQAVGADSGGGAGGGGGIGGLGL